MNDENPAKLPWSHPHATLKPSGSQPVGTQKAPRSHPEATLRLPRGYPLPGNAEGRMKNAEIGTVWCRVGRTQGWRAARKWRFHEPIRQSAGAGSAVCGHSTGGRRGLLARRAKLPRGWLGCSQLLARFATDALDWSSIGSLLVLYWSSTDGGFCPASSGLLYKPRNAA
jgi:hypothetical protein